MSNLLFATSVVLTCPIYKVFCVYHFILKWLWLMIRFVELLFRLLILYEMLDFDTKLKKYLQEFVIIE